MPLEVLGILVVVGLAAVIFTVHLTGGSHPANEMSEQEAKGRFAIDFPNFQPDYLFFGKNKKSAILVSDVSPELGLVYSFGDKRISRLLGSADIKSFVASPEDLTIALFDFSFPTVSIPITGEEERKQIISKLAKLTKV